MMTWEQVPGWFSFARVYDYLVEQAPPHGLIVEVGAFLGRSTLYMGQRIKESRKPLRFVTVDVGTGSPTEQLHQWIVYAAGGTTAGLLARNLLAAGLQPYVSQLTTTSRQAAALFGDAAVDAVFLDGDHEYEGVLQDLRCWYPKVKPGGLLAGHDYDRDTVRRATRDFFQRDNLHCVLDAMSWAVKKE
jgi:predicted O-methyltransferase YrrM